MSEKNEKNEKHVKKRKPEEAEDTASREETEAGPEQPEEPVTESAGSPDDGELKKAVEALNELNDRYTRMLAEYDNFRKRAQKEREGIYTDAYADVLAALLPVKDSLEMAMAYADDSKLSQGVTLTLNKFSEILKKLGVEEFGEKGEPFDPNLHNAVLHVEDETLGENVIADVLLKGYKKGDRILRYAMVKAAN